LNRKMDRQFKKIDDRQVNRKKDKSGTERRAGS
jgi:hypothetical protein